MKRKIYFAVLIAAIILILTAFFIRQSSLPENPDSIFVKGELHLWI